MEPTLATLFAALPLAALILYFSRFINEEKWAAIGVFVFIGVVLYTFYNVMLPDDFMQQVTSTNTHGEDKSIINWSLFFKWIYICLTTLIPAVFYMFYIVAMDSEKPEPLQALLLSVLLGVIAAFSVTALEKPLFIGGFESEINLSLTDALSRGFFEIAVPSELAKWLFLFIFLSSNKYYDEYLDGVIYSVCLSMGFSGVLSVWFLYGFIDFSASMFLFKGITTSLILIPIHLMSGVMMGYYMAIGTKGEKIIYVLLALIVPILIDGGICSLLAMMGGEWWYYVIIVILLFVLSCLLYLHIIHLMRLDGINLE